MRRKAPVSSPGCFVFGLCLFVLSAHTFGAGAKHHYYVQLAEDLSALTVKACFSLPLPGRLVSYDDDGVRHTRAVDLSGIKPGGCVSYAVDFKDEVTHPWFKRRQSRHQQVLLDIHRWLWFPEPFDADKDSIDITFNLPKGMTVSAPWQLIERTGRVVTYRYDQRPPDWDGDIAIGRFKTLSRTIGQAQVNIAILNGRSAVDTDAILQWVNKNLDALMLAYGKFPVPRLQVLVVPVGKDREPVPWGQVSESMSRNHLYMRVYWSGASIFLLADYALRRQHHNGMSLDSALAALHRCCLPS